MKTLLAAIVAQAFITTPQVKELNKLLFADGVIDREEMDGLFSVNDAITSSSKNSPAWGPFFAKAGAAHVLADDKTPGVLDEAEAGYLVGKIYGDNTVDQYERGLVGLVLVEATEVHPSFNDLAGTVDPS